MTTYRSATESEPAASVVGLRIVADGGCTFYGYLVMSEDGEEFSELLGSVQAGDLADNGEWIGGDDDVVQEVRETFNVPAHVPVIEIV